MTTLSNIDLVNVAREAADVYHSPLSASTRVTISFHSLTGSFERMRLAPASNAATASPASSTTGAHVHPNPPPCAWRNAATVESGYAVVEPHTPYIMPRETSLPDGNISAVTCSACQCGRPLPPHWRAATRATRPAVFVGSPE